MSIAKGRIRCAALFCVAVVVAFLANRATAAVVTYNFDVNGAAAGFGVTSGSTYDWDDTTNGGFWSNNTVSTTGGTATNAWPQGNFPKFQPAGAPNYTVTVSNEEQVAGMFFSTAQTVTINAVGSGNLNMVSGLQGVLGSSSANVTINAPIVGSGGIQPSNGGNISLNGVNTYSGGTNLSSTATLVHFNSGSSFGSGAINMGVAGFAPLLGSGGAPITLPNNFTSSVNGAGVNFAADANTPVNSTGTWTLGTNNFVLRNNGNSTSPLTLSGAISGSGTITLSANNSGSITFSGANTYTGTTTITGPGGTGTGTTVVRLKLGAANTIASSSSVVLAGGILDPGGINQSMPSTTLGLTASTAPSTIDFIAGGSEVDFANSSALTWVGTLNLLNWDPSIDKLRFGTDATGLTSTQLADIEFNGAGLGSAMLDANGYVTVPEPSSCLMLLGASLLMARRRRA
jgi:fibronectin-binding autotransporter adhesin